jgi:hypothetical protein
MDLSPRPKIRSLPIDMRCPEPGRQLSQWVITWTDRVRLVQILDAENLLVGSQSEPIDNSCVGKIFIQ